MSKDGVTLCHCAKGRGHIGPLCQRTGLHCTIVSKDGVILYHCVKGRGYILSKDEVTLGHCVKGRCHNRLLCHRTWSHLATVSNDEVTMTLHFITIYAQSLDTCIYLSDILQIL